MPLLPFSGPVIPTPVPISKGGTGSATQNFVDLSSTQTVGGTKTFSGNSHFTGTFNYFHSIQPVTNNTYENGDPTAYWSNLYATRTYLNSTAYLDGGTAGDIAINTAHSDVSGAGIKLQDRPTSASGYGLRMQIFPSSAGSGTGVTGEVWTSNSGTYGASYGGQFSVNANGSGNIVTAIGIQSNINVQGSQTATITNAYAAYLSSASAGTAGTITNNYGLYIDNQTAGGTRNYAIYTNSGLVRFGDQVQLTASTTSAASLNIPSGTAPTSPSDGDMWYDGTHLYIRIGSTTTTIV